MKGGKRLFLKEAKGKKKGGEDGFTSPKTKGGGGGEKKPRRALFTKKREGGGGASSSRFERGEVFLPYYQGTIKKKEGKREKGGCKRLFQVDKREKTRLDHGKFLRGGEKRRF